MADEPRRSGRATKGQHKNASSSPAPTPKPPAVAPGKATTAKSKPNKKSQDPAPEDDDDDDETIRCICGNDNPKDKRAFIGCEACQVWQHNVCMGVPDDEDDIPDHYFCEECAPSEHQETLQAISRGEKIWEVRNKIFQNEKKMSKSRKQKTKNGEEFRPGWLKKDVPVVPAKTPTPPPAASPAASASNGTRDNSNKRKREAKEEPESHEISEEKPEKPARQEKRRKSSAAPSKSTPTPAASVDTDTALVDIDHLPDDRKKVASSLAGVIETDIQKRIKSGLKLSGGQTAKSSALHHAARIEYALHMNHGAGQSEYIAQFRNLLPNLKRNTLLIQRLLDGSLSADDLSTMSSSDMASEELQRERAEMKEVLDRQAVAIEEQGPKYAQDHKGYHLIENEAHTSSEDHAPKDAPRSISQAPPPSASPPQPTQPPLALDASRDGDRRPSSQQFDMNNIWAKSAQSPTGPTPPNTGKPIKGAPRRRSSAHPPKPQALNGAKDDPDIDRMLEDDNDDYVPPDAAGADAIVWRGKLVQSSEEEAPTVNARFVAGRDLAPTVSWRTLLPQRLSIDGRLAIQKAEDYVSGLRWSTSSDVAVLSLSPYDNAEAFNSVFQYFHSRERYAVVEKDKPPMVKDLYIIPVEKGGELPPHLDMLEYCAIKKPIEERMLLATLIVARAPESPNKVDSVASAQAVGANGHLPPNVRQSIGGPQGSPITNQTPFSPANSATPSGYGAQGGFPPNPYGPQPPQQQPPAYPPPPQQQFADNRISQVLGELQYAPTAQTILRSAEGGLSDEQLQNLKMILSEDVTARTDFEALSKRLHAKP
ncbi:hypothetical protein AC578_2306 [Pseudocercospora eumusae]|uniref:Transcription factor BYE1 n=1 Tax=Pseudocercospora eumusae TaxID=321146 RepID=A0A139H188_9PEZI|nr:hypothetical protein AC578_2306 [Pseudocercospora eumusae]